MLSQHYRVFYLSLRVYNSIGLEMSPVTIRDCMSILINFLQLSSSGLKGVLTRLEYFLNLLKVLRQQGT
jgi:hypothetical protein